MEGNNTPNENSDIFKIELNTAIQHKKLALICEADEKYEASCKHYLEAANKLMGLLKSEKDEQKKETFKKHLSECITNAGMLKTLINDQKINIRKLQKDLVRPSN